MGKFQCGHRRVNGRTVLAHHASSIPHVGELLRTLLACENVTSDFGLGGVFSGSSGFLHRLQMARHDLAAIWQKK